MDNRRLIIGFLLLIAVCGAFFVIGFMEGKRQSVQLPGVAQQTPVAPATQVASIETAATVPANPKSEVRDQLDWYKNVQSSEKTNAITPPPEKTSTAAVAKEVVPADSKAVKTDAGEGAVAPKSPVAAPAVKSAKIAYTVQVGAFKLRHEAEVKLEALKGNGFDPRIEDPRRPNDYFRVKVGTFNSRAEATAMQLKLDKAGFSGCYITRN